MSDLEHTKEKAKGRLEQAVGAVTGDDEKKAEGEARERKATADEAKKSAGDAAKKAKDAVS